MTEQKNPSVNKSLKKKKANKKKKILIRTGLGFLIIILFAISALITYGVSIVNNMDKVELDNKELGITDNEELKNYKNSSKIKNIALLGVDSEDGIGRSDAIMIATIDPVHNKLKITSILRDSYVNIDGYGMDKINHAYAYGGPTLAIKTLNENFGLNIQDFATVNFESLPKIVEAFGGVELTITDEEAPHVTGLSSGGTYLLNGQQALDYSRIRVVGNDYERTHRQRLILTAIFKKGLSMPVTSYPGILNTISPLLQTSLGTSDILSLATKVVGIGNGSLEEERFPRDEDILPADPNAQASYINFDIEAVRKKMQDYIFDDKLE